MMLCLWINLLLDHFGKSISLAYHVLLAISQNVGFNCRLLQIPQISLDPSMNTWCTFFKKKTGGLATPIRL